MAQNPGTGSLADVLSDLHSSPDGLSSAAAARTLSALGPNTFETSQHVHWLRALTDRFRNPLVLVLLTAASISALTGEIGSFVIITTVIALSIAIDLFQERRAHLAAEALKARVALRVRVLRDGTVGELAATDLVPGDVVLVSAGNLVPADCRLLSCDDLFVNEALISGEAYPVEKHADLAQAEAGGIPVNSICMGSSIVSGSARAVVVATGSRTMLGRIADTLRKEPPPTAFTVGIHRFGMLILRLTALLVLFVSLINLLFGRPIIESFLFASALAVGLTPELLPMIVTVTLAHGAMRMSRQQVIVKRLSAIHDLGSMDVLCSDKTGTLTQAQIEVVRAVDICGAVSADVLTWAHVNAAFETGLKSPLDEAIIVAASDDLADWRKIDEVPFDFERRRVSVIGEEGNRRFLIVKGAPEDVLELSAEHTVAGHDGARPLTDVARDIARKTFESIGTEGCRALAVAWREVEPERTHAGIEDETNLVFAGYVVFRDPPKETAGRAVVALAALNVSVKIVTGDNERVTRHVCSELGLPTEPLLSGHELDGLSDEALSARVGETAIFCRVNPAQKERIIRVLKRRGHVVGYIGDGINDAPSLHAADVGISVDGAVDVAKDAASIIMLRNDLAILAEGVREGRRTFANIMKYVMMATSSNFGNMFSMAAGVLFLPFLPMLPAQILLNNLLYDLSEIPIPMDSVDDDLVSSPMKWDMALVQRFMLSVGPVSSIFDLITFAVLLWIFQAGESAFQTAWFVESLATQVLVIFIIRTRKSPLQSAPHWYLVGSSIAVLMVAIAIPHTAAGSWFGFQVLPIGLLAVLGCLTVAYLVVTEHVKRLFFARLGRNGLRAHHH